MRYGFGFPQGANNVVKLEPEQMTQQINQVLDAIDPTYEVDRLNNENEKLKEENSFLHEFTKLLMSKLPENELAFFQKMSNMFNARLNITKL